MTCQWALDLYVQFYACNYTSVKQLKKLSGSAKFFVSCFPEREQSLNMNDLSGWVQSGPGMQASASCSGLEALGRRWNCGLLSSWVLTWPRCPGWRWGVHQICLHTNLFLKPSWALIAQGPFGGPTLESGHVWFPQAGYTLICFGLVCILLNTQFSALQVHLLD